MTYNAEPDFVMRYCIQETKLSPLVRRMNFRTEHGDGVMFLLEAWPGVQMWVIDFHVARLPIQPMGTYHYLKMNYCFSGRCEVPLPAGYIYIDQGTLSVDINPPIGSMLCPGGSYEGLELVADLKTADGRQGLTDYGIDLAAAKKRLASCQGSFLAKVSPAWDQLARQLMAHIVAADLSLEGYRFRILELLWHLNTGQETNGALSPVFLTRGQRAAVMRAEAVMTEDLRRQYSLVELAAEAGVSPASLKKYFGQVYGKPVSVYLRWRRIERAKELLTTTALRIVDIASEVGYENQGKFGAAFRRETGVTPLEYRRLYHSKFERQGEKNEETI
ncbi:MAG: AraC family transcriptional regulator [Eubacteriales bacterium]|nr:AraC family transcriptional regulator [Eubacteriales bacterium]